MKLSISSLAWSSEQTGDVREILSQSAIRHIDTIPLHVVSSLETLHDPSVQHFNNFWSSRDFKVLGLQSLFYEKSNLRFFEDDRSCDSAIRYFEKIVNLSKCLCASVLILGSPKQRFLFEERGKIVEKFFKSLSCACEIAEIYLCLEPNSIEYGTNFLVNTRETAEYITELRHKNIMMNFDTGCDLMNGEDPVKSFERYHNIIGHIHLSCPYLRPVNKQSFDHLALSKVIKQVDFRGGVTIEMMRDESKEKSLENIRSAIQVLQDYYI